jgi:Phage integrase, N-terminal SAM-like domain
VTIQPVSQPVRPLRRRMLEDMAMRGLLEETQRDYVRFVRGFAAFLRRPPDTATSEDIRRFQVHQAESGVQPRGFHRIRHYGFLASVGRKANVARARELLAAPARTEAKDAPSPPEPRPPCPCCGGRMVIIEIFQRAVRARAPPPSHPFTGATVP